MLHTFSITYAEVGLGVDDTITKNTMQSTKRLGDSIDLMKREVYSRNIFWCLRVLGSVIGLFII